jgi:hypothetical protein
VRPARFERATPGLEGRCSIQLSYGHTGAPSVTRQCEEICYAPAVTALADWESFYVIVGSSAGALTGLQFIVMALIADMPVNQTVADASDAFSTPTIVHFSAVLLLSAVLSAPWHGLLAPLVLCSIAGVIGFIYVAIVVGRMRRQRGYAPVFEDWLFHVILPVAAYGILAGAALAHAHADLALAGIAVAALVLLFVGIHNAWDSVTYLVFVRRREINDRRNEAGQS